MMLSLIIPSHSVYANCIPLYEASLKKDNFFSRNFFHNDWEKMLGVLKESYDGKADHQLGRNLKNLEVESSIKGADLKKLIRQANKFNLFCRLNENVANIWNRKQLITRINELPAMIEQEIKMRKMVHRLQLSELAQRFEAIPSKLKTILVELGKNKSDEEKTAFTKMVQDFQETLLTLETKIEHFQKSLENLENPTWANNLNKKLTSFYRTDEWDNLKIKIDLILNNKLKRDPSLQYLLTENFDLNQNPWPSHLADSSHYHQQEIVAAKNEIYNRELEILNRKNGQIQWNPQRSNYPMTVSAFNPRTGETVKMQASHSNQGIGLVYNPLKGEMEIQRFPHGRKYIYGRYNPSTQKVEWSWTDIAEGKVYLPENSQAQTRDGEWTGNYRPPYQSADRVYFQQKLQEIEINEYNLQKNKKFQQSLDQWEKFYLFWQRSEEEAKVVRENMEGKIKGYAFDYWNETLPVETQVETPVVTPKETPEDICAQNIQQKSAPQVIIPLKLTPELKPELKPEQYSFCPICRDPAGIPADQKTTLSCGHSYCTDCVAGFVKANITANENPLANKYHLNCPENDCGHTLNPYTQKYSFLTANEIRSWQIGYQMERLQRMKSRIPCTRIGCPGGALALDSENPPYQCGFCRSCLKCGELHRKNLLCEQLKGHQEAMDGMKKMLAAGQINLCPDCKAPTERIDGCNHMTCPNCKLDWHYVDGNTLDNSLYVTDNEYTWGGKDRLKKYNKEDAEKLFGQQLDDDY